MPDDDTPEIPAHEAPYDDSSASSEPGTSPPTSGEQPVELPPEEPLPRGAARPLTLPPSNDDFANAIVLSGAGGSFHLNTEDATRDTNDPETDSGHPQTVWWKYVATADGALEVKVVAGIVADAYFPYMGIYQGTVITALTPVAYNSVTAGFYDELLVNFVVAPVTAGQTYYIEIADSTGIDTETWPVDRDVVWRFIERPTWGTLPAPIGTSQLAVAMASFSGLTFPSDPDANGGIWTAPAGWNSPGDGTIDVVDDYLLQETNDLPSASTDLLYADSASADPDNPSFETVSVVGDTEYQVGFIIEGQKPFDTAYLTARWAQSTNRLGFEAGANNERAGVRVFVYLPGPSGADAHFSVPQGWPIRLKFTFVDSTDTWRVYVSFDGGATFQYLAESVATPGTAYQADWGQYGQNDTSPYGWSVKWEGWGAVAAAAQPKRHFQTEVVLRV